MTLPQITVALVVSGFEDSPEEISRRIGADPTDTWKAGDLIREPGIRKKSNGWRLKSGFDGHSELEPHLRWLLDKLSPSTDAGFGADGRSIDFSCNVVIADRAPSLTVPRDVMERIAQLGADLDIDITVVPIE